MKPSQGLHWGMSLSLSLSLSTIYLPPIASLDGVSGYQHDRPELGEGLPQTLVVLPRRRGGAATHRHTVFHVSILLLYSLWPDFRLEVKPNHLSPQISVSSLGFILFFSHSPLFKDTFSTTPPLEMSVATYVETLHLSG